MKQSESVYVQPGLTVRGVVVAVVLTVIGAVWVRQVSLIAHTCQVAEGTPSVPALTGLVLLAAVPAALGRWGRCLTLSQPEVLLIYLILTLAVPMSCANVVRQLLPNLTALRYFASPENSYAELSRHIPAWLAPTDAEAIRTFYEASEGSYIPWASWALPLLAWSGLICVYSLTLFCFIALFRKPWSEHERLMFPLVELALQIAPAKERERNSNSIGRSGADGLLRNRLFWVGFGVAALFNFSNIVSAFNPQVAALGAGYDLGGFFSERPWSGLRPLYLAFRPEIVGLGYLVSLDVLFSAWFFYLLLRFENFVALLIGYSVAGFPFDLQQGTGAYWAVGLFLLFSARSYLREVVRKVYASTAKGAEHAERGFKIQDSGFKIQDSRFRIQDSRFRIQDSRFRIQDGYRALLNERGEPLPYQVALFGFLIGTGLLVTVSVLAGMTVWSAVGLFVLSFIAALVYSRIRVQTGIPVSYVEPRGDSAQALVDLLGSSLLSGGNVRALTVFSFVRVLQRMTFPQMTAAQVEGLKMAEVARIKRSHLLGAVILGLLLGLATAYGTHMTAYYTYGCNILEGGSGAGGWRTRQALIEFECLQRMVKNPQGPNWQRTAFRGVGFVLSLTLLILKSQFLRFPLNPLGLAIAATFGYHIWFGLFTVWLCKSLILQLGGPHTYRRWIPLFLGLAVGHFLVAGALWGLLGLLYEEPAKRYLVWFT